MILSASGWRAVFAEDENEESSTPAVREAFLTLAVIAAEVFAEHMASMRARRVVVGTDTRPTGPAIASAAVAGLQHRGLQVERLGISASPEIMAYAAQNPELDGFFYVSASHNPVGHNGIKFGGADGGVIGGETARTLIKSFRSRATDQEAVQIATNLIRAAKVEPGRDRPFETSTPKRRAIAVYESFTRGVLAGPGPDASQSMEGFSSALARSEPGIVVDYNGSARAASIDRTLFSSFGCQLHAVNDVPGGIAHVIVPEGPGLRECKEELERMHARDARFVLGYVPDNDGDRGNLVVIEKGRARQLEAQEVFALSCISELSWMEYAGALQGSAGGAAIVANGPTSLRVDRIAAAFGAQVYRSEVGEANVVSLARSLREQGLLVRILGEGSNGGTIVHPAAVRDPLQTVFSLLKLLLAPAAENRTAPISSWAEHAADPDSLHPGATLHEKLDWLLQSLPKFTTTSAFSDEARMKIQTVDHDALKSRFESLLPAAFARLREILAEQEIDSYEILNYEGTSCRIGAGNRTGAGTGGLKLSLRAGGVERGFAWMRGSGTEPVFRVMIDLEGHHKEEHDAALQWLRSLVRQADGSL